MKLISILFIIYYSLLKAKWNDLQNTHQYTEKVLAAEQQQKIEVFLLRIFFKIF